MNAFQIEEMPTLLLSGMGQLPGSCLGVFAVENVPRAKECLRRLTQAYPPSGLRDRGKDRVVQLAFSAAGLVALGVEVREADGFDRAFCEGMTTDFRQRTLGDLEGNSPAHWRWSDVGGQVALWVFTDSGRNAEAQVREIDGDKMGLRLLSALPMDRLPGMREHFGFRDGISNPRLPRPGHGDPDQEGAGDFVFGSRNALGELALGPSFGEHATGEQGTYLVLRQIRQDVPAFWRQWREAAGGNDEKAIWLASKALGRWPNGMPMEAHAPCPMPPLVEEAIRPMDYSDDAKGLQCPFGAHVRRANPREDRPADGLPPHRLFRRGRIYGPVCPEDVYPAGLALEPNHLGRDRTAERGILFACLATDLVRQFEFVQQTWINNPKFKGLHHEVDPTTGGSVRDLATDVFTIPAKPFRHRVNAVRPNVQVVGGGYFFLPGHRALEVILA